MRWAGAACAALLVLAGCSSATDLVATPVPTDIQVATPVPAATPLATPVPTPVPTATPVPSPTPIVVVEPEVYVVEVLATVPHSTRVFTTGLEFGSDGLLYESSGRYVPGGAVGQFLQLDPETGEVLRSFDTDDNHSAAGLTVDGGKVYQATESVELVFVWLQDSLILDQQVFYEGPGGGLCAEGSVMFSTDGSSNLTFRDFVTFEPKRSVIVRLRGQPLSGLGELECVDGQVWAVLDTGTGLETGTGMVRIDPETGAVTAMVDTSGLLSPDPAVADPNAVLSGIAWDRNNATWVFTGRLWPQMLRVVVLPA